MIQGYFQLFLRGGIAFGKPDSFGRAMASNMWQRYIVVIEVLDNTKIKLMYQNLIGT